MEDEPRMRTNGFERPFHPLQVVSWVVFGSDVFLYIVFSLPLIETVAAKTLVALFYVASVVVLVLATVKATWCDPADPHVRLQESEMKAEEVENMPYCTMCNVPVYARSKHCRACNKCIGAFDHHCMWLNNCVGAANYRAFLVTISSVAFMIGIVLCTTVYLLADYFVNEDMFEQRLRSITVYRALPKEFFLGLLVTMAAVNGPLFILDVQLVFLHAFLASQGLTTYEYIVNKRDEIVQRERGEEGTNGGGEAAGRGLGQKFRSLPHCMDWIVFSRCCQRRRKKRSNGIQRIERDSALKEPVDAEAGAAGSGARGGSKPVDATPSPPGSTVDLTDEPGDPAGDLGAQDGVSLAPTASSGAAGSGVAAAAGPGAGAGWATEALELKVPAPGEAAAAAAEPPSGVHVAAKTGCGCDASSSHAVEKQPASSKL